MPFDMVSIGLSLTPLWLLQGPPDQLEYQDLSRPTTTDETTRHCDGEIVADADHTSVQEFVMHRAQAQAVLHGVRPIERPPAHMSGVERYSLGAELAVVAAHGTAVLISHENSVAEGRIPPASLQVEPDRSADVLME